MLTPVRALTLASCMTIASLNGVAQTIPEPGAMTAEISQPGMKTMASVAQISAQITAIDYETRRATLVGSTGREVTITAGEDIQNLEAIKVGDLVTVEYARSLTLELHKNGTAAVGRVETVTEGRAPVTDEEGGVRVIDRMVNGVANVIAVDPETQIVTLEGAGTQLVLSVSDPEQFKLIEVGDQIEATLLEGAALSLTKQNQGE